MRGICNVLIILFLIIVIASCKEKKANNKKHFQQNNINSEYVFLPKVKYAKGFSIDIKNGLKEITVYNPWKNNIVLRKYVLIPEGVNVTEKEEEVSYIQMPVNTVALFSNTHIGPLVELGLTDKIVGLSRAHKIYNAELKQKVNNGQIPDIGGAHNKNLDIEKIMELNPNLILLSAFNEVKSGESHLDQIGFNMAYALNWMEDTPLGRAEWIKFVAAFFNKDKAAADFFDKVVASYKDLAKLAQNVEQKPSVVMGWPYGGTWYVPGGQNYMVNYLRDAGGDYFLFDDNTRGNIPMSVESVLDQCNDADIWIYPSMRRSRKEIEDAGEIFTQFKAFRDHQVYNIYKRAYESGGSDWWETATIRPDIVLKDFIKILHPEILPNDSTYFMSKLQ